MTQQITSRANPLIAHVRRLGADRTYRRQTGEFLCEGPKLLEEALRWGAQVETVLAVETLAWAMELPEPARLIQVPEELLRWAGDTKTPQGVLFVCRMPSVLPPDALTGSRYLVLDGLQDPGNVGTIWRTADAFGADGLFLLNHCADPFAPKTVRATMGAVFRLPVWECGLDELCSRLRAAGIPLIAAALQEHARDLRQQSLKPAAVVIGSEGRGVSPETLLRSDAALKIPMEPRCESLNAAAAACVVLWEMFR